MIDIIFIVCIIFLSIILHECAHGWVAYQCGDPTAKLAGRLTLNPLKHIDPVGTVLLPGILLALRFFGYHTFLFGWAKPVPVNFFALRHPKRDMISVGFAGPATNFMIAFFCIFLLKLNVFSNAKDILEMTIFFNFLLAVFNLIPIPPLDGSRIVTGLLPRPLDYRYASLEKYGLLIVFALIYFGLLNRTIFPIVDALGNFFGVKF
ncbi:MAG: site-2 protease family protein [Candidatus Omnitrophica bacterium]|nr:site-2 protease family protein [Candidatus Omnitrophota bacterium]